MAGFFDGLYESTQNPLFLGGIGLMSGGFQGMQQGMQTGAQMQDRLKKQEQQKQQQQAMQNGLASMQNLTDSDRQMFAANPELAQTALAQMYASKFKPNADLDRQIAEANLAQTRAQTAALGRREVDQNTPTARARYAVQFGLDPNSDAFKSYALTGKMPREDQQQLTATDKKAVFAAEDEIAPLNSSIDALMRAKELNGQSYTGYGAGLRASLGSKLPDYMVPDFVADPKSAAASNEFGSLMSYEAIKSMSDTLKGATTDRELGYFVEILGNPSTPPDIRGRVIDRMTQLYEEKRATAENRKKSLIDGTYYKPGGGVTPAQGAQPAPSGVGGAPIRARNPQTGQTIEWNGSQWVPAQ